MKKDLSSPFTERSCKALVLVRPAEGGKPGGVAPDQASRRARLDAGHRRRAPPVTNRILVEIARDGADLERRPAIRLAVEEAREEPEVGRRGAGRKTVWRSNRPSRARQRRKRVLSGRAGSGRLEGSSGFPSRSPMLATLVEERSTGRGGSSRKNMTDTDPRLQEAAASCFFRATGRTAPRRFPRSRPPSRSRRTARCSWTEGRRVHRTVSVSNCSSRRGSPGVRCLRLLYRGTRPPP